MYVTLAQLAEIPGAKELSELASTEHEALVDYELMDLTLRGQDTSAYPPASVAAANEAAARITSAVGDAGAYIDGFLSVRGYTTPLVAPVPGIITTWARAIARYYLAKDRITDPKSDPIARDYADATKLLQLVANGQFSLGAGDPLADTGLGEVTFENDGRVFNRPNLRGPW